MHPIKKKAPPVQLPAMIIKGLGLPAIRTESTRTPNISFFSPFFLDNSARARNLHRNDRSASPTTPIPTLHRSLTSRDFSFTLSQRGDLEKNGRFFFFFWTTLVQKKWEKKKKLAVLETTDCCIRRSEPLESWTVTRDESCGLRGSLRWETWLHAARAAWWAR